MYYQIEGRLNMKTLVFDEEGLTVGNQLYPIDEIEKLEITNAPLFATYGILNVRTNGRNVSVPFARSAIDKIRRAIHDFEHEQKVRQKAAEEAAAQKAAAQTAYQAPADSAETVRQAQASEPVQPVQSAEPAQPQPVRYMDPYEEVKKMKELLDMGIVTEEEFQKKKKELLNL